MRVTIIGGGVGGLSAAHELAERGVAVEVFEAGPALGGKARSLPVPGSAIGGRLPLMGEHGFRHYPPFYRHLVDTMRRVPRPEGGTVADNRVLTRHVHFAFRDTGWHSPVYRLRTADDLLKVLEVWTANTRKVPPADLRMFVRQMLRLAGSCEERRRDEWEHTSWYEFARAAEGSEGYRLQIVDGMSRSLAAMQAWESSARTVGTILLQLIYAMGVEGGTYVMNGPTTWRWFDPWEAHLRRLGVTFHLQAPVRRLVLQGDRVVALDVQGRGEVEVDEVILAVPVEQAVPLLDPGIARLDPALGRLRQLRTGWMKGVQYFVRRDRPITDGHTIHNETPWALTSVSQASIWKAVDWDRVGDGTVRGVLSAVSSDWFTPSDVGPAARDLPAEAVKEEFWRQMGRCPGAPKGGWFTEDDVVGWFMDPAIHEPGPRREACIQPMLLNTVGHLVSRPEAATALPNLRLAADWVHTTTDLACMEGANEAARRAVNHLLDAHRHPAARCDLFPLHEPAWARALQRADRARTACWRPR